VTGDIHDAAARGFAAAADAYERGRPGYPNDAVAFLIDVLRIGSSSTVLDLAAGTGKLTRLLVPTGATLVAVEPVEEMRGKLTLSAPSARALAGTAEAIPFKNGTVDVVTVAQAFHWFDGSRALAEIHRVLRPGGSLGLIWNVRDESAAWSRRLTEIFDRLSGENAPRYKHGRWRAAFETTELFGLLEHRAFRHAQKLSRAAFADRVMSVSYVASASEVERGGVLAEIHGLLETDPDLRGREEILDPYRTDVFWCERR
jgi:SAM-dependent methyltransferase